MANDSLRQVHPNGLPEGFIAMSDAKVEPVNPEDGTMAVSARLVVTDPAGAHHAVILQFFWDGTTPAGDHAEPGHFHPG